MNRAYIPANPVQRCIALCYTYNLGQGGENRTPVASIQGKHDTISIHQEICVPVTLRAFTASFTVPTDGDKNMKATSLYCRLALSIIN